MTDLFASSPTLNPSLFGSEPERPRLRVADGVVATAKFSPCGRYRYTLTRTWDDTMPAVVWCMLNPSTASETVEDPTVRKCQRLARRWGYGGIVVVNLFALRSTDPKELYKTPHPVAPPDDPEANDLAILEATGHRRLIAAWGCHGAHQDRGEAVLKLLGDHMTYCVTVTKGGFPGHPLYVTETVRPMPYAMGRAS